MKSVIVLHSQNQAADYLLRVGDGDKEQVEEPDIRALPKELKISQEIKGGGDSMLQ